MEPLPGGGHQILLPFKCGHGGLREGAGRKPSGRRAGDAHVTRPGLSRHTPVHVTLKLMAGLPGMRNRGCLDVVLRCFEKGCERFGFRLIHFSIQSNHFHLIAEAEDQEALSRGMQGLVVRLAKNLNKYWGRRGQVFPRRYHCVQLTSLRQVRNALAYVLLNNRRHDSMDVTGPMDPCSSSRWFDGWREEQARAQSRAPNRARPFEDLSPPSAPPRMGTAGKRNIAPVVAPESWSLRTGWRRHYSAVSVDELPRGVA